MKEPLRDDGLTASPSSGVMALPRRGLMSSVVAWPLVVAVALPLLAFAFSANIGLNLLDEGFVWYGAQRVLAGELPLRDFQAYDPARYFWSAAWMALAGSAGIVPLRAGNAVLTAGVVVGAVLLVRRGAPRLSAPLLALAALTVFIWRVPAFKAADSAAVVLLVAGLATLIERCTARRAAVFGVCLGVASMIGINHALYGVVAGLLAGLWLGGVEGRRLGAALPAAVAAGAAVGYAPVLALHLGAPGFSAGFVDSIRMLFETGTTNVTRALPRLSAVWLGEGALAPALRESLQAVTAAVALVFLLACLAALLRPLRRGTSDLAAPAPPLSPVFVAAVLTSLPYAHHVLSRFELPHLAVSLLPVLLAAWTAPPVASGRWPTAAAATLTALALLSAVIAGPDHALYQRLNGVALQSVGVGGETLLLREPAASEVRLIERAVAAYAGADRAFYAAPYWPAAYALMRRRSPTWEIYAIFPATVARQRREIERLAAAHVALAILTDARMDERDDMGLAQTHPLLARYLRDCMTLPARPADGLPEIAGVSLRVERPGGCIRADP